MRTTDLVWLQGTGLCSQEGWGGGRSLMLWPWLCSYPGGPLGVRCRSCPSGLHGRRGQELGCLAQHLELILFLIVFFLITKVTNVYSPIYSANPINILVYFIFPLQIVEVNQYFRDLLYYYPNWVVHTARVVSRPPGSGAWLLASHLGPPPSSPGAPSQQPSSVPPPVPLSQAQAGSVGL